MAAAAIPAHGGNPAACSGQQGPDPTFAALNAHPEMPFSHTRRAFPALLPMLVLGLAACTSKPNMKETTAAPKTPAFDVAGMDTAAKPCDDFDQFA
ncbi:MAG: hypothetical protein JST38_05140, partial [Bacteroidetes bacterium]|nr:hypothetical protein [Bacteroidota bacterium]